MDERLRALRAWACGEGLECHLSFCVNYLLEAPWMVRLLDAWVLGTPQPGRCTPRTTSPSPREARPTGAAACNGRGDPLASGWPGKESVSRTGHRAAPPPPSLTHSYHTSLPAVPYQHEVLVPLQLLHSPGQPLPLLLPGLILQASEFLVALFFPNGFVLDLAQGDH